MAARLYYVRYTYVLFPTALIITILSWPEYTYTRVSMYALNIIISYSNLITGAHDAAACFCKAVAPASSGQLCSNLIYEISLPRKPDRRRLNVVKIPVEAASEKKKKNIIIIIARAFFAHPSRETVGRGGRSSALINYDITRGPRPRILTLVYRGYTTVVNIHDCQRYHSIYDKTRRKY